MARSLPSIKWHFLAAVVCDKCLSAACLATMTALLRRHNIKNGRCYPSMKRIAKDTGYALGTIKKAIKRLKERGWLRVRGESGGWGRSNLYEFAFERVTDWSSSELAEYTGASPYMVGHQVRERTSAPAATQHPSGGADHPVHTEDNLDTRARSKSVSEQAQHRSYLDAEKVPEWNRNGGHPETPSNDKVTRESNNNKPDQDSDFFPPVSSGMWFVGHMLSVTVKQYEDLQKLFSFIDLRKEIVGIDCWYRDHPERYNEQRWQKQVENMLERADQARFDELCGKNKPN